MKIQVIGIADRGMPNRERLHLSVTGDADLSYYVVLKNILAAPNYNTVYSGGAPAYWFPSTQVRTGDQVILLSGKGTNSSRREPSGTTTYFFYWGFDVTLWNTPADNVIVLQANEWATSPYGR